MEKKNFIFIIFVFLDNEDFLGEGDAGMTRIKIYFF